MGAAACNQARVARARRASFSIAALAPIQLVRSILILILVSSRLATADTLEFIEQQRRFDPFVAQVSPDGRFLYAAATAGAGVGIFRRDATTGALSFVEVHRQGVPDIDEAGTVRTLTISPDGKNVYVGTRLDIVTFAIDPETGALTFVQDLSAIHDQLPKLDSVEMIAVSPDGAHVYTANLLENSVGVFARDPTNGMLAPVEFQTDGVDGVDCLHFPRAVTVSGDGANVYATSSDCQTGATLVFARDPQSGKLALVETQRSRDLPINHSTEYPGLADPYAVVVSPDGENVYIAGFYDTFFPLAQVFDGIGVFRRDPATGSLTFLQALFGGKSEPYIRKGLRHLRSLTVSPDGRHVYTGAELHNAVARFDRDSSNGTLTLVGTYIDDEDGVDGLAGTRFVTLSPDGQHAYAAAPNDNAVTSFSRDADSGALSFVEANRDASAGLLGLEEPRKVVVSPDGAHVYVTSRTDNSVVVLRRTAATGRLAFEQTIDAASASEDLLRPEGLVLSPNGEHLYVGAHSSDALLLFDRDQVSGQLTYRSSVIEPLPDEGANNPLALAASPDGKNVYVANGGGYTASLAAYRRDLVTGELSLLLLVRNGVNGVQDLQNANDVVVSPDGKHVYAIGNIDLSIVAFRRTAANGGLTFIESKVEGVGGVHGLVYTRGIAISGDGRHVYVASNATTAAGCCPNGNGAVAVFRRDLTTGSLTFAQALFDAPGDANAVEGLYSANDIEVSPDGKHVFVAGLNDDAVVMFARDPESGLLVPEDIRFDGIDADGIQGAINLAVSPDGAHLYALGYNDDAVAAFAVIGEPTPQTPTVTNTPGPVPTETPPPTDTAPPRPSETIAATATATDAATATPSPEPTQSPLDTPAPSESPTPNETCLGDCNADGDVTVDEVLNTVNIILGNRALDECSAIDADDSGNATIDELIAAIGNVLDGCPL